MEAGCGTGRLMAIMEENGYEVTGLDLSPEMLEIARTRCRGELIRQDMREIRVSETFDALLCLGSGFTYMQTEGDVDRALRSFADALREGGMLIFDNFDADGINFGYFGRWRESVFDLGDMRITRRSMNSDYREADDSWRVDWLYIIEKEGGTRTVEDSSRIRAFHREYLRSKLARQGFRNIDVIQERRLTMTAEKRRKS